MTETKQTTFTMLFTIIFQITLPFLFQWLVRFFNITYPILILLSQILSFILPATVYFIVTKKSVIETLRLYPLRPLNIIVIVLLSILIQPIMGLLSYISSFIFPNAIDELITELMDLTSIPILFVCISVIPAICEEIFFRGVIFSGYRQLSIIKASLMTGLFFAIMHLDAQQFLYTFVLGSIFCIFVHRTNSIFSSVISHFTINGTQVALAIYASSQKALPSATAIPTAGENLIQLLILIALTLPAVIFLFWIFFKINPVSEQQKNISSKQLSISSEKVLNIPFVIILLLYIVVAILFPLMA